MAIRMEMIKVLHSSGKTVKSKFIIAILQYVRWFKTKNRQILIWIQVICSDNVEKSERRQKMEENSRFGFNRVVKSYVPHQVYIMHYCYYDNSKSSKAS